MRRHLCIILDDISIMAVADMNEDVKRPGDITIDSTDEERTAILREKVLTVVQWDQSKEMVVNPGESTAQALNRYSQDLNLRNKEVNFDEFKVPIQFTRATLKESIFQMTKRNSDLMNLAKLLSVLESVCQNAIKIDVEEYRHASRESRARCVHHLLSAFHDGEKIYPVKITIHEKETENQFYMVITVGTIEISEITKEAPTNTGVNHLSMKESLSDGGASFKVNITSLVGVFKRDESIIIKNLPDCLLNERQQEIKFQVKKSDSEKENKARQALSFLGKARADRKPSVEELEYMVDRMEGISSDSVIQVHIVREGFLGNQVAVIGQELGLEHPGIDDPTHNPQAPKR